MILSLVLLLRTHILHFPLSGSLFPFPEPGAYSVKDNPKHIFFRFSVIFWSSKVIVIRFLWVELNLLRLLLNASVPVGCLLELFVERHMKQLPLRWIDCVENPIQEKVVRYWCCWTCPLLLFLTFTFGSVFSVIHRLYLFYVWHTGSYLMASLDWFVDGYSTTLPHLRGLQNGDTAASAIKQVSSCLQLVPWLQ